VAGLSLLLASDVVSDALEFSGVTPELESMVERQ
jgi:hypothetical protein